MRLDKYLKNSRLIKRRTIATEACNAGKVFVNSKIARASYDVKIGDIITLQLGTKSITVRVVALSETATKASALTMYEVIE